MPGSKRWATDSENSVKVGDVILVVDVGGGTTDFSLIAVTEQDGDLQLTRMAVGDHILLGGDNMDLTLAHHLAAGQESGCLAVHRADLWMPAGEGASLRRSETEEGSDLDSRAAALRSSAAPSKLELTRDDVTRILIDGFMPKVDVTELPRTARRTGLTQIGLPYAQDPGITRHLAAFLTRQSRIAEGKSFVHPTAILFNGGVFKASVLKDRVIEVLNAWLAQGLRAPCKGTRRRRSRSRCRARRRVLRLGSAWPWHPDSWRHRARILRRR